MAHTDVYNRFIQYFPHYKEMNPTWFQNGKNSIRIRFHKAYCIPDLIFSIDGKEWSLETVNTFVKRLKGGRTNAYKY